MSIYKTKKFARAWHRKLERDEDILRTKVMNNVLIKEISLKNKVVLDAGCGNGFFLKHIVKLNPKVVHAFDISPTLLMICKERYPEVNLKIASLLKKLPYKSSFFDVVICYNVLMDLPRVKTAVRELARVTKKAGYVHVVIVHPLYNLFINDKKARKETAMQRLKRYTSSESVIVDTLPDIKEFLAYRRPLDFFVNEFARNNLFIEKMVEVPVKSILAGVKKYREREGMPVFAYFKLRKLSG